MTTRTPQPTLSAATRIAAAFAVFGIVSATCAAAVHESRIAVRESAAAMSGPAIYVTLPTVEIVAHRDAASTVAATSGTQSARAL